LPFARKESKEISQLDFIVVNNIEGELSRMSVFTP